MAINQPIPSWLSNRSFLPKTPMTNPSKNLCRFWYQNHQTPHLSAKPLTRRLEKTKRSINTKRRLGGIWAPQILISIQLILPAEYATVEIKKMQVRLSVTTIIRRGILRGTILNLKKIRVS